MTALFFHDEGNEFTLDDEYELMSHIESGAEFLIINEVAGSPSGLTFTGNAQGQTGIHVEHM